MVAGAATGAAAMLPIAAYEALTADTTLRTPLLDLSRLGLGGAAVGLGCSLLGRVGGMRAISPGGIVLGLGVALHLWLGRVAGAGLVGGVLAAALSGALWLGLGAMAGQALGVLLGRIRRDRWRPGLGPQLALLAALALPLASTAIPRSGSHPDTNVLLLTVDTLRADRMGFAGHPRATSPYLDRLARRGIQRPLAVTPLPRTLPAVVSMMTGAFPHTHGVRDNFHYSLGDEAHTLAEVLAAEGWETGAVNSNPVLSHDSGVYQGFGSASDRGDDWAHLATVRGIRRLATLLAMRAGDRAQVITDLALDWLQTRSPTQPYFLWVHWLSPHMPYEPRFPFDRIFDPGYSGAYAHRIDYGEISKGDMTYRNPLSAREMAHVKALYDGEIATADRAVGRLLQRMDEAGDLDRTVILFTSDHGESLDEHGYFLNHGDFVYGPAANVPLILVNEEGHRGLESRPVSLVDVMPTLLDGTGVAPPDGMDGRLPSAEPRTFFGESGFCRFPHLNEKLGGLLPREIAQSPDRIPDWKEQWEVQANRAKQRFAQAGPWKLVLSPSPDGDRLELFDLAHDPAERTDAAAREPELRDALHARLSEWIAAGDATTGTADAREITDELRERLDGLGYLGD